MDSEKSVQSLAASGNIRKSYLSHNQYTLSLLNEALRSGMLNSNEVYGIQGQLLVILKKLIGQYTRGKSSSVSTDTAEGIFASILYAIDAYTSQFDDPKEAVIYLKTARINSIYEKGLGLVHDCFRETEQLYKKIHMNQLDVAVEAYNLTISESIPVFLRKYDSIFDAPNTMASIDYPLAIDDMGVQGVFYIKQYLTNLRIETEFCRLFSKVDLQMLLTNYGKVCRFDYRIELFNIFRLVFNNAVFSILSGGNANRLRISENQYNQLEHLFTQLNDSQTHSIIYKAIDQVGCDLNIGESKMKVYMEQCGIDLIQMIINVSNHDNLQTAVIMEKEIKSKSIVTAFNASDRMSDEHFRLVTEKIMGCKDTTDKVEMILENFHSLYDYIDLMNSNCLLTDDYAALFRTFGEIELAILVKMVFYEEFRDDAVDLSSPEIKEKQAELEWKVQFIAFITNMNTVEKRAIEKYVNDIDYEEINFY